MASGDHCFTITIAGRQVIEHKDCDEYVDGTWTDPMAITRAAALISGAEKRALISAAVSRGERREVKPDERPVTGQKRITLAAIEANPELSTLPEQLPRLKLGLSEKHAVIIGTLEQLADVAHHILSLVNGAAIKAAYRCDNVEPGSEQNTCILPSGHPNYHVAAIDDTVTATWPND